MYVICSFEVDFVSAPFCVAKRHIYEGIENIDTFFRPALRSLLVSTDIGDINIVILSETKLIIKTKTKLVVISQFSGHVLKGSKTWEFTGIELRIFF